MDTPPITITNVAESTALVITLLLAAFFLSFRKTQHSDLFPIAVTQELKGFGILTVVFAHISYMLVNDSHFLYPLSRVAGLGVDLFLFMSGYGLTVATLKKPLSTVEFYKRRLIKVFIPFWLVLIALFFADTVFLHIHYSFGYMLQSLLGWFPTAHGYVDVNSPFWYITWMLMFYALFPLVFNAEKPWLTAIILAAIAHLMIIIDPFKLQVNWLYYLHTNAFSLGIVLAWLLKTQPQLVAKLMAFRNESTGVARYVVIGSMVLFAGYLAAHNTPSDWSTFVPLFDALNLSSVTVQQVNSLLMMLALIIVFSLKRLDNRFLHLFGVYSYETYLLHWPLMGRYDVFFNLFPAWLAVLCWLAAFIGIGWLLQKITQPLGVWLDSKW